MRILKLKSYKSGAQYGPQRVFLVLENKKPLKKRGFKGGPTWARTKDPLIMSQLL